MNGSIYSIRCKTTGEQYIGSTMKHPEYRLEQHRSKFNKTSSRRIIDRNNFELIVLEEVFCDDKMELLYRERYFVETEPNVVNKCRPIVSSQEKKQQLLDYTHTHKPYFQKYRDDHREKWQGDWTCPCCDVLCRLINKNRHERSKQHKSKICSLDVLLDM